MYILKSQVIEFLQKQSGPLDFQRLATGLESEYWISNSFQSRVMVPPEPTSAGLDYIELGVMLDQLAAEGQIQKLVVPVEVLPGVTIEGYAYAARGTN